MFLLGERDVKKVLSLQDCLDINRKALLSVVNKQAFVPTRLGIPYPNNPSLPPPSKKSLKSKTQDWTLIKPAAHYDDNSVEMGMKLIGVRSKNPSKGLPLVPATIMLFNSETSVVEATIGGTYLTVARTSAGPALAVKTFRPDVEHLVLFGAGAQAECHVELMQVALERNIPKITIVNRTLDRAQKLRATLLSSASDSSPPPQIQVVRLVDTVKVNQALSTADVISATTNTSIPLWADGSLLPKNCLITGIGSYTPDMQEIPPSAVDRAHIVIDTPEAMDVGDLRHLKDASSRPPITLAGDAFENPEEIGKETDLIFYKAVGTAIQDVLTARAVVNKAKEMGVGHEVDMS
eukprot:Nitzschia sp. Nitz4//scaffold4_size323378//9168//10217//NITZ4_000606-RA/size323378-processed-gene-0.319-mRNA-1//-1//CDS//3329553237//6062//frame0